MNLIDLGILIVFALFVLHGYYKGFLISVLGTACFFVCWLLALMFSPLVSKKVLAYEPIYEAMLYYTEGAEKLANVEYSRMSVDGLPAETLDEIIDTSELYAPIDDLIRSNISGEVFKNQGILSIGDYFNQTIVNFAINVFSFMLVFLISRIVMAFIIGALDYISLIPRLTHFDGLMGAGLGLVNGFFMLFLVFMVVPLGLTVLPFPEISDYINSSFFGAFFYNANFLLSLISGVI